MNDSGCGGRYQCLRAHKHIGHSGIRRDVVSVAQSDHPFQRPKKGLMAHGAQKKRIEMKDKDVNRQQSASFRFGWKRGKIKLGIIMRGEAIIKSADKARNRRTDIFSSVYYSNMSSLAEKRHSSVTGGPGGRGRSSGPVSQASHPEAIDTNPVNE